MAKYLLGATGIDLGTAIKYLRRTTRNAAGSSLGTTIKYLRRLRAVAPQTAHVMGVVVIFNFGEKALGHGSTCYD
jgi:hypothetical protein